MKAKLTNMAYQSKQLKEQNQSLMSEMGDKVRESVENAKDAANDEITKCRNDMGKTNLPKCAPATVHTLHLG